MIPAIRRYPTMRLLSATVHRCDDGQKKDHHHICFQRPNATVLPADLRKPDTKEPIPGTELTRTVYQAVFAGDSGSSFNTHCSGLISGGAWWSSDEHHESTHQQWAEIGFGTWSQDSDVWVPDVVTGGGIYKLIL